jgi:hypothetical protein
VSLVKILMEMMLDLLPAKLQKKKKKAIEFLYFQIIDSINPTPFQKSRRVLELRIVSSWFEFSLYSKLY